MKKFFFTALTLFRLIYFQSTQSCAKYLRFYTDYF
jgi:hypothetical protein